MTVGENIGIQYCNIPTIYYNHGEHMNKALIAHWSYKKKDKNGDIKKINIERLIGIYKSVEEAIFIERKAKKNFEVNCNFKIEDSNNEVTTKDSSVSKYLGHLRGRNGKSNT